MFPDDFTAACKVHRRAVRFSQNGVAVAWPILPLALRFLYGVGEVSALKRSG